MVYNIGVMKLSYYPHVEKKGSQHFDQNIEKGCHVSPRTGFFRFVVLELYKNHYSRSEMDLERNHDPAILHHIGFRWKHRAYNR